MMYQVLHTCMFLQSLATIWSPGISITVPILQMNRLKSREQGSGFFIAGKSDPCSMSVVSGQALTHCALSFRLKTSKVISDCGRSYGEDKAE